MFRPHFLDAPQHSSRIDGLHPQEEKHRTGTLISVFVLAAREQRNFSFFLTITHSWAQLPLIR